MSKSGLRRTFSCLLALGAITSGSAEATTLASGDVVVSLTSNYCCSVSTVPDAYVLNPSGAFKGFFFQPFNATDTAIDSSGRILFASSGSSTIVATDANGAFLGFVPTPVNSGIDGLAVASNGDLLVASDKSLYRLDNMGQFIGLTFLPDAVTGSMGVDSQDRVFFPVQSSCCSSSTTTVDRFDLLTGTNSPISIALGSVSGLDVSETGVLIVSGSASYFNSNNSLYKFGLNGGLIGPMSGPGGGGGSGRRESPRAGNCDPDRIRPCQHRGFPPSTDLK